MSIDAERRAIEGRFATMWAASPYASVPVQYFNTPAPSAAKYVALHIVPGKKEPGEIGRDGFSRNIGMIQADIYVAADTGSAEAIKMAEIIEVMFYRETWSVAGSGPLTGESAEFRPVGVTDGRAKFVQSVTYRRDSY